MSFVDAIVGAKPAGLKMAFQVNENGVCQNENGDKTSIVQSAELFQQIHKVVSIPSLNSVVIATDNNILWTKLVNNTTIGAVTGTNGDNISIDKFFSSILAGTGGKPAGLSPDIMPKIQKIASEYLSDFAETALLVQVKQAGVNQASPTAEQLQKLFGGLEKAAMMIVGPTQAKEMGEKLRKLF
jgi:hypothetical protein